MSWPEPKPGLVIRYAYLWAREAAAGREEGSKDRPCAIVLVAQGDQGAPRVSVLPVTHTRPADPADAVEIPAVVKARLGLDDARSWIMLTEANEFFWPGPDLRPLPGRGPDSVTFGFLPPRFFLHLRDRWLAARARRVGRTE